MATKAHVAAAARGLFAAQGYVATSIAAIAEAADIPAPTIYSAFGSKATILRFIAWDVTATLDIDASHEQAAARPDPADGLRLAAGIQRRQYELMYDVVAVYQEAARTDPDIARDLRTILANREQAFSRHVESIVNHLGPGRTIELAIDLYLALVLPEIYRTLVLERGWSNDQYETWLADSLIQQVLGTT